MLCPTQVDLRSNTEWGFAESVPLVGPNRWLRSSKSMFLFRAMFGITRASYRPSESSSGDFQLSDLRVFFFVL